MSGLHDRLDRIGPLGLGPGPGLQDETGSTVAEALLARWAGEVERFVKVMPRDYKRVLLAQSEAEREGREGIAKNAKNSKSLSNPPELIATIACSRTFGFA